MNILKAGKLPDSIAFTCSVCGCEYEAEEKDYMATDVLMYKNKPLIKVFKCPCPCCGWLNSNNIR